MKAMRLSPVFFLVCLTIKAQTARVLVNHLGYEQNLPKKGILLLDRAVKVDSFQVLNILEGEIKFRGKPVYSGPVDHWKNWIFYTLDFASLAEAGRYQIKVYLPGRQVVSYPFMIGTNILEQSTISDLVYYFKGQRSDGLMDKADHTLFLKLKKTDTLDLHGGWYDATGDYGKHLSHLSFSAYFNPQQITLTDYNLFKTLEILEKREGADFHQINRRILDEALYGADFLVRMKSADGSFYRSVGAPGPKKLPADRNVQTEDKSYRIKQTKDQSFGDHTSVQDTWQSYQTSFRSGGGMAIASLAIASTYPAAGAYKNSDYLNAAEKAFAFLEINNVMMCSDHKENIIDNYCALTAATELYRATKNKHYLKYAQKRAKELMDRLSAWDKYRDYWRADDKDRPFFHPADAGLPVVSLFYYYPLASSAQKARILSVLKRSFRYEFSVTHEVKNPFGYSRQLVQDTLEKRRTSFFFPHGSEAAPWWQGENARLASMAAAARLTASLFITEPAFHEELETFAVDQLNWIFGLNPYNASMMQGVGHNNASYNFFGTFEYTNAPGGIVNGATSGLENEHDIDFNLSYAETKKDNDWRWVEQWLPHAAWTVLAVAAR